MRGSFRISVRPTISFLSRELSVFRRLRWSIGTIIIFIRQTTIWTIIDQTQLQRNNFIIGAMALYLAYAEAEDIPLLASETYAQGGRRMANDLTAALQILNNSDNWADAHLLIEQGSIRERRALNSMRVIAEKNQKANQTIDTFLKLVDEREKQLLNELSAFYQNKFGKTTASEIYRQRKRRQQRKFRRILTQWTSILKNERMCRPECTR